MDVVGSGDMSYLEHDDRFLYLQAVGNVTKMAANNWHVGGHH